MNDLPLGFAMSLAQNSDAMEYFSHLTEEEKQSIIEHTHQIQSKQEMRDYVNQLRPSDTP